MGEDYTIGARIKMLRESLELTLREMARRSGVPASTISRIERSDGDDEISVKTLMTISSFFGVTPDYLLGYGDNPREGRMLAFRCGLREGAARAMDHIKQLRNNIDQERLIDPMPEAGRRHG